MSRDVDDDEVISKIKAAQFRLLSLQQHKLTDSSSCSQVLLFVRQVTAGDFKEFLFCSPFKDYLQRWKYNEKGN